MLEALVSYLRQELAEVWPPIHRANLYSHFERATNGCDHANAAAAVRVRLFLNLPANSLTFIDLSF
jgi:hypothetical protein